MSRTDSRSRRLRRRPSRVVPATLVAAVLTAAGVLAVLAAAARLVEGRWPAAATGPAGALAGLRWGAPPVVAGCAVLALLGLVLLVAALKRGAFGTATLAAPAGGDVERTEFVVSTRGLASLAAGRAEHVDGVEDVRVSASAGRVHLRVSTTSEQTGPIADRVRQAVSDALSAAGVQPLPRVTAHVTTKGI